MQFIGQARTVLDSKHRVTIPAEHRHAIDPEVEGEHLYLCAAMDPCIWLLTETRWNEFIETLQLDDRDAIFDPERRNLERYLYQSAKRTSFDKQGRITLPEDLRAKAKIEGDILIIGVARRIELWDPKTHANHMDDFNPGQIRGE